METAPGEGLPNWEGGMVAEVERGRMASGEVSCFFIVVETRKENREKIEYPKKGNKVSRKGNRCVKSWISLESGCGGEVWRRTSYGRKEGD